MSCAIANGGATSSSPRRDIPLRLSDICRAFSHTLDGLIANEQGQLVFMPYFRRRVTATIPSAESPARTITVGSGICS